MSPVGEEGRDGRSGRTIKVLTVTKALAAGGAENLFKELDLRLVGLGMNVEVAHVLPAEPGFRDSLHAGGVSTVYLGAGRLRWIVRLAKVIARGRHDVVHVHSPLPGSVARVFLRLIRGRRCLLLTTEHNSWSAYHWATRHVNALTIGLDDVTVAVSEAARISMSKRTRRKAIALTHGIDLHAVQNAARGDLGLRAILGVDQDQPVFACVAHHRAAKDHRTLLRALHLLHQSGRSFHCVLVGEGTNDNEMQAMVDEYQLRGCVTMLGRRDDAASIIAQSTALVLSSLIEGMPVVIMEAATLGIPVVTTRVGGIPEHLTDGVTALLVDPADHTQLATALSRVIDDPALRHRLATAIGELAGAFDIEASLAVYVGIYHDGVRPSADTAT